MTASGVPTAQEVSLTVGHDRSVSALLTRPPGARSCYVLAHGAGAGMRHPFMSAVAEELGRAGVATLRYQFPYMERRSRRPDPPALCHATVRAAVALAAQLLPAVPLVAGGRSFGGRMTSQAQAEEPLPGVRALAFLGFPLHPAGRPGDSRAEHLARVAIPMRFVQGTRDALADRSLLEQLQQRLGERASIDWVEDGDHSFHVPARSGMKDEAVRHGFLERLVRWIELHA